MVRISTKFENLLCEIHITAMKRCALGLDLIEFSVHNLDPEPFCRNSGLKYEQNLVPTRLAVRALICQMPFNKGTLTI